jgi:hypothetical protein
MERKCGPPNDFEEGKNCSHYWEEPPEKNRPQKKLLEGCLHRGMPLGAFCSQNVHLTF